MKATSHILIALWWRLKKLNFWQYLGTLCFAGSGMFAHISHQSGFDLLTAIIAGLMYILGIVFINTR